MQRFWSRLAVELGKRAGLVAAVGLLITGVLGFGTTRLEFATDQDSYLNRDDQVYIDNVEYQDLFGGQAMLSVITLDEDVEMADFIVENRAVLEELGTEIRSDDGVEAAITPMTAISFSDTLTQLGPDGEVAADPTGSIAGGALANAAGLVPGGDPSTVEEPGTPEAEARTAASLATVERLGAIPAAERTLDNPVWIEFLLYENPDPDEERGDVRKSLRPFFPAEGVTQIVTRLDGNMSIEDEGAAADHVTDAVDAADLSGAESVTVGAPTLLQDINSYLRGGILSLGAIAVGGMVVVLLLLFKVRWRLLPLLVVLVGVTWAFGLAGYLGIPLSLVTISGLPVMLGVGIDYAIQMHARVEEEVVVDRSAHPIQESARNLGPALLVVTVDAALAFAALKLARVPMIRDFGDLLVVGIIAICLCSIVTPIAVLGMREFRSPTTARDYREGAMAQAVVKIGSLPMWTAIPFAVLSLGILAFGVSVEGEIAILADPVEWVDQSSETVAKIDRVEATTGSSSELGVYVRSDDVFDQETVTEVHHLAGCALGTFPETTTRDDLMSAERCEEELLPEQFVEEDGEDIPALLTASSVVTTLSYLLELDGASVLPPRAEDVQAAWELAPEDIRTSTATEDGAAMNLIFRTGYSSLTNGEEVVRAFDGVPTEDLPEGDTVQPSGLAVVGVGLLDNIESNRAQLTYLSIGFVGLFLVVRLRSLVRSLLSLVPVLIATGMASIVAWGFGLELSPMTAVGGPLVVAVCTEFTSLMLLRFVEERKRGFAPQAAADVAAARTGRAFVVSAATTLVGVGVIATSSLPLLRGFGLIVGLNVVIALASALVVLPPMLVWADQEGREWVSKRLVPEEDLARSRGGRTATDVPPGGDPTGPGTFGPEDVAATKV